MSSSNAIRSAFLRYFEDVGHQRVSSASLVPHDDPSLLFVNAGMVPFKDVFTGLRGVSSPTAVSVQKCLRVSGKHNDLDNVGYTARHHTFFEMMGNFSFGDYFKEQAITLAWNLLVGEFGISPQRLWITVYAEDDESAVLWRKIAGVPEDRITRISGSDNFWSMGETGPCGPCSEVFYDYGERFAGSPPGRGGLRGDTGDRYVEIWNLVFMQYEQEAGGKKRPLPCRSVDTGMGLERLAALLQGTHDNYRTDILHRLILEVDELSQKPWNGALAASHRVIADHVRAAAFLIADGVLPDVVGRGYVLRRILRRAFRHAHKLGCKEPLLHRLIGRLQHEMGAAYPELARAESLIVHTLRAEEDRFAETLERGLALLLEETSKLGRGESLSGEVTFRLYDTFGFPPDLTDDILRAQGRSYDRTGFADAMRRQRLAARAAWRGAAGSKIGKLQSAAQRLWSSTCTPSAQEERTSRFVGYEHDAWQGEVKGLLVDQEQVSGVSAGQDVVLLADRTPFYAESGGQLADRGHVRSVRLRSEADAEIDIRDVQRLSGDLFLHIGRATRGHLRLGDKIRLCVSRNRRAGLRVHHSATHLLHESLRRLLGNQVVQRGSLVAPDRLRFDVRYPKAIAPEVLHRVERMINARIRANDAVETRRMELQAAIDAGAMALFGEKYASEVRVVCMGGPDDPHADHHDANRKNTDLDGANHDNADARHVRDKASDNPQRKLAWSVELCGGLHVRRTGDIGLFRIVSESASASGVRRLEAVAGAAALARVQAHESVLQKTSILLPGSVDEIPQRLQALLQERRRLERELRQARLQLTLSAHDGRANKEKTDRRNTTETPDCVRKIGGIRLRVREISCFAPNQLKRLADAMEQQFGSGVIVLLSEHKEKTSLVVAVSDDLTHLLDAARLTRAGALVLHGQGGGRRDLAQGGGPRTGCGKELVDAITQALQEAV